MKFDLSTLGGIFSGPVANVASVIASVSQEHDDKPGDEKKRIAVQAIGRVLLPLVDSDIPPDLGERCVQDVYDAMKAAAKAKESVDAVLAAAKGR